MYFKDTKNKLHFLDDAKYAHLLPQGSVQITDEEYAELTAPKPKTLEEIIIDFETAVQAELDADAQAKGYDNIISACAYAGAPNPFQDESKLFVTRRGNVWAYCYAELDKVINGTRPMPTIEQIISELPARVSA